MRVNYSQVISPNDVNVLDLAIKGYGVYSGCSVTPLNGMSILVTEGTIVFDGNTVSFTEKTLTLTSSSDPKKAIVYADDSSAYVSEGVPEPAVPSGLSGTLTYRPRAPLFPEDKVPLAEIWIDANATSISASDIYDRRCFIKPMSTGGVSEIYYSDVKYWANTLELNDQSNTVVNITVESLYNANVLELVNAGESATYDVRLSFIVPYNYNTFQPEAFVTLFRKVGTEIHMHSSIEITVYDKLGSGLKGTLYSGTFDHAQGYYAMTIPTESLNAVDIQEGDILIYRFYITIDSTWSERYRLLSTQVNYVLG